MKPMRVNPALENTEQQADGVSAPSESILSPLWRLIARSLREGADAVLGSVFSGRTRDTARQGERANSFATRTPWTINEIKMQGQMVLVEICDNSQVVGTIKIPRDSLKLIQYVGGSSDKKKKLYAEVRFAPKGTLFAPGHKILYLGELDDTTFDSLRKHLENQGLEWVWYPTPRKEKLVELLPQVADVASGCNLDVGATPAA